MEGEDAFSIGMSAKQGYNIYSSAAMTIWSAKERVNYFLLGGGISYELLTGGQFGIPGGFPYSSNLSVVRYEPGTNDWSQFFANASYPRIPGGEDGDADDASSSRTNTTSGMMAIYNRLPAAYGVVALNLTGYSKCSGERT